MRVSVPERVQSGPCRHRSGDHLATTIGVWLCILIAIEIFYEPRTSGERPVSNWG